jgi:hypothetical protein
LSPRGGGDGESTPDGEFPVAIPRPRWAAIGQADRGEELGWDEAGGLGVARAERKRGGGLGWAKREKERKRRGLWVLVLKLYDFQNLTQSNKKPCNQNMMLKHLLLLKLFK